MNQIQYREGVHQNQNQLLVSSLPKPKGRILSSLGPKTIIFRKNVEIKKSPKWAGTLTFKGAVPITWWLRNHKYFSKYIFRSCLWQSSLWYSTSCCKIDRKNSFVHGSNIFWADSMRHLLFVYARTVAPGSHLSRVWTPLSYPLCKISWSDVPTTSRIQEQKDRRARYRQLC